MVKKGTPIRQQVIHPHHLICRWGPATWYIMHRAPVINTMWAWLQLDQLLPITIIIAVSETRATLLITTWTFQDTLIYRRERQPGSTQTPMQTISWSPTSTNRPGQTFIYLALPSCAVRVIGKTNLRNLRSLVSNVGSVVECLICSCGFVTGSEDLQTEWNLLQDMPVLGGVLLFQSQKIPPPPQKHISCKSTSTAHVRAGALPQRGL